MNIESHHAKILFKIFQGVAVVAVVQGDITLMEVAGVVEDGFSVEETIAEEEGTVVEAVEATAVAGTVGEEAVAIE